MSNQVVDPSEYPMVTSDDLATVVACAAQRPVLIQYRPGTGLRASLVQIAWKADVALVIVECPTLDLAHALGLPLPDGGMLKPVWQQELEAFAANGRVAWVYLEELSRATPDVGRALIAYMAAEPVIAGVRFVASDTEQSLEFATRWQCHGGQVFVWGV